MAHDQQDKRYAESRSPLGAMTFEEINRHIGVTMNPEIGEHESGTSDDREVGINDMQGRNVGNDAGDI